MPLRSRRTNAGARLCTSEPRAERRAGEQKTSTQAHNTSVRLMAFFNAIAFVHPIVAEVVGDVENLHIDEAALAQLIKGRPDIGTTIPWTTAAVENDKGVFG